MNTPPPTPPAGAAPPLAADGTEQAVALLAEVMLDACSARYAPVLIVAG